jgi:hypothetical protein
MWGWMKCEVYNRRVDARIELLARILDAAARIKKREDQLRRTTRDLQTRGAKCTEVDGAIFERFERQIFHFCVTNLSFEHYIKIKIKATAISPFLPFIKVL